MPTLPPMAIFRLSTAVLLLALVPGSARDAGGGAQAPAQPAAAPAGEPARPPARAARLQQLAVDAQESGAVVTLTTNAPLAAVVAREVTDEPFRVFVDLPGVVPAVPAVTRVDRWRLGRIRVALNAPDPPVTRVVVELTGRVPYRLETSAAAGGRLQLVFGDPATAGGAAAPPPGGPAPPGPPSSTPGADTAPAPEAEGEAAGAETTEPPPPAIVPRTFGAGRTDLALRRDAALRLPAPLPLVNLAEPVDTSSRRARNRARSTDPQVRAAVAIEEARRLFVQERFEAALMSVSTARKLAPASAEARLLAGRAGIERYRQTADPLELDAALDALDGLDGAELEAQDRPDLVMALAMGLYMTGEFRAAADFFEAASESTRDSGLQNGLLDWWATAMDRHAHLQASEDRPATYERVRARMDDELRRRPGASAAGFWRVAALRARGDLDGAWNAAIAGWVRAQLGDDGGVALRELLDAFVTATLIPEQAGRLATPARPATDIEAVLMGEWTDLKGKWTRNP